MSGLKCEVGYNNETQVLECEGSWDKMKTMMADVGQKRTSPTPPGGVSTGGQRIIEGGGREW